MSKGEGLTVHTQLPEQSVTFQGWVYLNARRILQSQSARAGWWTSSGTSSSLWHWEMCAGPTLSACCVAPCYSELPWGCLEGPGLTYYSMILPTNSLIFFSPKGKLSNCNFLFSTSRVNFVNKYKSTILWLNTRMCKMGQFPSRVPCLMLKVTMELST